MKQIPQLLRTLNELTAKLQANAEKRADCEQRYADIINSDNPDRDFVQASRLKIEIDALTASDKKLTQKIEDARQQLTEVLPAALKEIHVRAWAIRAREKELLHKTLTPIIGEKDASQASDRLAGSALAYVAANAATWKLNFIAQQGDPVRLAHVVLESSAAIEKIEK